MGKLAELLLIAGPILGFAVYELVKLRREKKPSKEDPRRREG